MHRTVVAAVLLASSVSRADPSVFARGHVGIGGTRFFDYDEPHHEAGPSVGVAIGATVARELGVGLAVSLEAPVGQYEFYSYGALEWTSEDRHYRPLVLGLFGEYRASEQVRIGALVGTQLEWVYERCYADDIRGRYTSGCSSDRSLETPASLVVGASVGVSLYTTGDHGIGLEAAVLKGDGYTSAVVAVAWAYR